ncbi:MAG: methionine synthase [Pseudonocardiaceae bacterium]|nr:methionine synthase [Pseudonocardiaceae bacterium]
MTTVYRADVVGSLLRPEYLKQARAQWKSGEISTAEFKRLEDLAVDQAIALQEATGVDVVTDGEMRREIFSDHVFKELNGLSDIPSPPLDLHNVNTGETVTLSMPTTVTGKISRKRMLATEEFVYARARSRAPVKATLSSPLLLNFLWSPEYSPQAYDDPYDLFRDGAAIIREEALELARLGCEYIQIDAPELIQVLADESQRRRWESVGLSPDWVVPEGIELVNSVAAPIPGVTFALHVCRANAPSMYLARGGYGEFAEKLFPLATNYDIFSLEYDDERSGDFAPLAKLPSDKVAALGLVSTKVEAVEDRDEVTRRIQEAASYVGLDRLALSTQCGFASMEAGNELSVNSQEAKLQLVGEVAHRIWN